MLILDGKQMAADIRKELKEEIEESNIKCGLAVILAGENEASKVYVKNKIKACTEVGIQSFVYYLPENIDEPEILHLIEALNKDSNIHGILVQLPLPKHLNESKILAAVYPEKDVDGFTVQNFGKMVLGDQNALIPCTPQGIMEILKRGKIKISGQNAVVVGRSNIVGKPIAMLLLRQNATVTITHSKTQNLSAFTSKADILIAAVGCPEMIKADMVKKGAVVIDVGINRTSQGLKGDVDFENVSKIASAITPVPGGVGPMTIAMLLSNTLKAAKQLIL